MKCAATPARSAILALVVAVCLAVTLGLLWRSREDALRGYRSAFDRDANLRMHLVIDHLQENLAELDSVRRFYLGSQVVERSEFASFVRPIIARRGDVAAFAWVPARTAPQSETGPRAPYRETRSGPADLDGAVLEQQPAVRVLLDLASATGIASAITEWPAPGNPQSQRVVMVAMPVTPETLETPPGAAPAPPRGHLIIFLDCRKILATAVAGVAPTGLGVELVELRDGGPPIEIDRSETRLPNDGQAGTGLLRTREIPFAGRRWQVEVSDTSAYYQRHYPTYHRWILPVGLLLTTMLALYLGGLLARQGLIEQEVLIRTDELREREERLRLIRDTAPLAIVVWDVERRVTDWNPAATALFGWTREEALGRDTFSFLVPEDQQASVGVVIRQVLEGRLPTDSLHENATKDGRRVLCQWHHAAQRDARGTITGGNSIGVDVTERLRAQAERDRLLESLETANREQEDLIRAISHDLRSPLVSLMGFARRLERESIGLRDRLEGDDDPVRLRASLEPALRDRIPEALRCILSSGEKIEGLAASLTRLSRTRTTVLRLQRLDVPAMLHSIMDAMAYQIQQTGAIVELGELPPLLGDPDLISQVFSNLLDNALKYRDPERPPNIRVEGRIVAGLVRYTVQDNGRGIPRERQEKIWELFSRVNPTDAIPGEGVGLAIVRRIVERHAGKISVESEPGRGSVFVLEFPQGDAA